MPVWKVIRTILLAVLMIGTVYYGGRRLSKRADDRDKASMERHGIIVPGLVISHSSTRAGKITRFKARLNEKELVLRQDGDATYEGTRVGDSILLLVDTSDLRNVVALKEEAGEQLTN